MIDFLNNGKVLIGSQYDKNPLKPKYIEQEPDMLELQKWLICDRKQLRFEYWCKVAYTGALVFGLFGIILFH
jgi:hypothetical protein